MSNPETTELPPLPDEIKAHEELTRLGLAALDIIGGKADEAHEAFRDALADWSDDTLWRLLMRVKL